MLKKNNIASCKKITASEPRIVSINTEVDVFTARLTGDEICRDAEIDMVDRQCIVTSISELALNIVSHAGTGTISLRVLTNGNGNPNGSVGVEVIAEDRGPGIEDIGAALEDGFSTNGTMGCGLPGVKRLMSEIDISSQKGKGTVIRAVKWTKGT